MERTIYNPQKARLETVPIEFTDANTTWLNESRNDHDIYSITDFDGGLVISVCGYDYPVWVYGVTRTSIGYNRNRAFKLQKSYRQGTSRKQTENHHRPRMAGTSGRPTGSRRSLPSGQWRLKAFQMELR